MSNLQVLNVHLIHSINLRKYCVNYVTYLQNHVTPPNSTPLTFVK